MIEVAPFISTSKKIISLFKKNIHILNIPEINISKISQIT